MFKALLSVLFMFTAQISMATIDSEAFVTVPYQPAQVGFYSFEDMANNWGEPWANAQQYCLTDRMYFDFYSSSFYPTFVMMLEPYQVPTWPPIDEFNEDFVQMNVLFDGKLNVITDGDSIDTIVEDPVSGQWWREPIFTVDVSGYDQSTAGGRLESLVKAKLAVASIHYNLARYGSLFRAQIDIVGLPENQQEFVKPGFRSVVAQTQSPYSTSSPLVQSYYDELLSPEFCSENRDKVKEFAN